MNIRKAQISDIKPISIIMKQAQDLHYRNRKDIFREKTLEIIEKTVNEIFNNNENEKMILVAENEINKVVGILIYKIRVVEEESNSNLKPCRILSVDELAVEEKERGKGIGKALMKEAVKIKEELECNRIELNCWEFNENALNFYKSIGMKVQRTFFEM